MKRIIRQFRADDLIIPGLILLMLGFLVYVADVESRGADYYKEKRIMSLIEQEVVPGADRRQVEVWLKKQGTEQYAYEKVEKESLVNSIVNRGMYKQSRHPRGTLSGVITVRLETRRLLGVQLTQVTFFFDRRGRLLDFSIEKGGIFL